jgi:hypothetical protein
MTGAALPVATGHAGRLSHRGGLLALGLVGARGMRGARTGLAFGAARGNPAPTRGPAGCLLDGLPPRRRRRQGRCGTRCAPFLASLRDGLRPALTAPASTRPGETRSPGAGEEQRPTSRQEARTVADQDGTPHPRRHLLTHPTRKEAATDRTTTATEYPAPSRAPRRGQPCPTPTSPSPAT